MDLTFQSTRKPHRVFEDIGVGVDLPETLEDVAGPIEVTGDLLMGILGHCPPKAVGQHGISGARNKIRCKVLVRSFGEIQPLLPCTLGVVFDGPAVNPADHLSKQIWIVFLKLDLLLFTFLLCSLAEAFVSSTLSTYC